MTKLTSAVVAIAAVLLQAPRLAIAGTRSNVKLLLTNDDGWAVAQIRSEYDVLKSLGYQVVLSAPAVDKSGTNSTTAEPVSLDSPCQFDSCPAGSLPVGINVSDPYLSYVNAYPVDAARYGIQNLSPRLLGGPPDLVISGVNIGNNLGKVVNNSGTVGAAAEAAREGIPSIAFSGASNAYVSYTTLISDPSSPANVAARIYTNLVVKFIDVLLANSAPLLPVNTSLNVNFPPTDGCNENEIEFVFTRLLPNPDSNEEDIDVCDYKDSSLPDEESTLKSGCYATVSVFDARRMGDVPANIQQAVYDKLEPILSCLSESPFNDYCV